VSAAELPAFMAGHQKMRFLRELSEGQRRTEYNNLSPELLERQDELDAMNTDDSGYDTDDVVVAADDEKADGITSWMPEVPGSVPDVEFHRPVLDLDFDAALVPSSTEGHWHLYLDALMPWDDYAKLLTVMAEVGILEQGYVDASLARGYSSARLPGVMRPAPRKVRPGRRADVAGNLLEERCNGCKLEAHQLPEYAAIALDEDYGSSLEAMRREEGTYNRENGHFWCNSCYIKAGMPLGVAL